uniref:hypothetical protein n=1 Tax=Altererythrobacter segetis TaxID=1104773 RepID=UPI00140D9498|nr:hypothetical protein [Altererythrobacter segetis]
MTNRGMDEGVRHPTTRPWTVTTFEALVVVISLLQVIFSGFFWLLILLATVYFWMGLSITRKRSLSATGIFTALTVLNIVVMLVSTVPAMLPSGSQQVAGFDWPAFAVVALNVFQVWLLWNPLTRGWLATGR